MNHELAYHLDEYIKEKRYRLINSVLLIVDGETVIERYYNRRDELSRNNLKSMWKSILSLCAGICLDRGLIARPDQPVADFLPQFAAGVHPYHRLITVEHLLTMSSGIYWNGGVHYHCPMMEQICRADDQLAEIADVAMSDLPGTRFDYKEFDVILLSALLGRAVGGSVFEFCRDNLYSPLGIESGRWPTLRGGVEYTVTRGEEQSDLSARDLARIGALLLENDGSLVSRDYVGRATSPSAVNAGYGYLIWLRENGFEFSGFGGQQVIIIPDKRIVYVIQATPHALEQILWRRVRRACQGKRGRAWGLLKNVPNAIAIGRLHLAPQNFCTVIIAHFNGRMQRTKTNKAVSRGLGASYAPNASPFPA